MEAPRGRDTKGTDLYAAQVSLRSLPFRPPMIVEARIREQAGDAGAPARCGQPLPAWGPAVLQPDRAPLAPCCSPLFPSPLPPFQGSLQFFSPQKYRSQPVIHNRINMKDEIKKQIQNFQRSSLLIEELTNYDKEVYFNSCIIQN